MTRFYRYAYVEVIVHEKNEDKEIATYHIPNRSPNRSSLLTNLRKNGTLLCIIEEVKSSIAILALYTFMLSIFFIKKDSISFLWFILLSWYKMEEFLTENAWPVLSLCLTKSLFPLQFLRSDFCCWNLLSEQSLSPMYCKLLELQGIEYMPASFSIPLVTLLRRYFFVVLQELYTNLTFFGTKRLIFPFSHSGGLVYWIIWFRYVDDVFAIIPNNVNINAFLNSLNLSHSIKFITEKGANNCLPFLDVQVMQGNNNRPCFKVYRKPTHSNLYINAFSGHSNII